MRNSALMNLKTLQIHARPIHTAMLMKEAMEARLLRPIPPGPDTTMLHSSIMGPWEMAAATMMDSQMKTKSLP